MGRAIPPHGGSIEMAGRYSSRARRSTRSTRRSSYRAAAPRRSVRSRSTSRRRAGSGAGRTIRIEVVAAPANPVSRPEIGMKAAPAARKAKF